jgi:hypothetical protein
MTEQTATKAYHARGVLAEQREGEIVLTVPTTDYRIRLKTYQPISTPIGKRLVGIIRAQARRVDVVHTGGCYIEPVYGRPRRVQGEILEIDPSGQTITVHAGAAPIVCKLSSQQRVGSFKVGDFVSFDVLEGASFSQV